MKNVSDKMNEYLNKEKNFNCADLYELYLRDGSEYFFTDYDDDVKYNGKIYLHNKFIINRTRIKTQHKVTVDKMTVTIFADENDNIGKKLVNKFAHDGGFDRAMFYLKRIFLDDKGNAIGHVSLFGGLSEVNKVGGLKLILNIKAETQGLNRMFPCRRYYPQTPYGSVSKKDNNTALIAPFVPRTLNLY